jgi:tetratricopeptide (TPR) repeat protein
LSFKKQRRSGVADMPGTLIQREQDLRGVLEEIRTEVIGSRRLSIIEVRGEAGIGKTRFLSALTDHICGRQALGDVIVGTGTARLTGAVATPLQPFRALLHDMRSTDPHDDGWLTRLVAAAREAFPEYVGVMPAIGPAAKVTVNMVSRSRSGTKREPEVGADVSGQILTFLEKMSQRRPIVAMLDDMHSADQASTDLLLGLGDALRDRPVAIIVGYRSDDVALTSGPHPLTRALNGLRRYAHVGALVDLERLDRNGVRQLTAERLDDVPSEYLVTWLHDKTRGNPLFLHEFVSLLAEQGMLRDGGLTAETFSWDDMPMTVRAVLEERLRFLGHDSSEHRVLQVASVVGNPFTAESIAFVGELDHRRAVDGLRKACQRHGLIRATSGGEGYSFFHAMVDEHLQHALKHDDPPDYRRMHQRAAALVQQGPQSKAIVAVSALARHLHEAGDDATAGPSCLTAAEHAADIGSLVEAVTFYTWSSKHFAASGDGGAEIGVLLRLGETEQQLRRLGPAETHLQRAAQLAADHTVAATEKARLLVELAKAERMQHRWVEANDALKQATTLLPSTDPERRARGGLVTGEILLCGPEADAGAALEVLQRSLTIADSAALRSALLGHIALALLALGDVDGALSTVAQADAHARRSPSPAAQYECSSYRAHIDIALLRLDDARVAVDDMRELAVGYEISGTEDARYGGRVAALDGDFAEAASCYVAFLRSDLKLAASAPTRRSWVLTHVACQLDELAYLRGVQVAAEFCDELSARCEDAHVHLVDDQLPVLLTALQHDPHGTSIDAPCTRDVAARASFNSYNASLRELRRRWGLAR